MNNTLNAAIKTTSSKLLLGYDQHNHTDTNLKQLIDELASIDCNIEQERQTHVALAKRLKKLEITIRYITTKNINTI